MGKYIEELVREHPSIASLPFRTTNQPFPFPGEAGGDTFFKVNDVNAA